MMSHAPAPEPNEDDAAPPRVAVVVPVFDQAAYLEEAVASALLQTLAGTRVVIVNDGCPDPASERIGRAIAAAEPNRVIYLQQANKGLSAARNAGIRAALARWPGIEAVFPLDADNRLAPETLARLIVAGAGDEAVGFVFPYLIEFGARDAIWQADAHVTLTRLLCENQCDAGSLIDARVFAAGHFFDEAMREGFEDWEFFIRLLRNGYRARCGGLAGFQYRVRDDSMLSAADAKRARLLGQIAARHAALFRPQARCALEHRELPRFLYLDAASGHARAFSDPALMDESRAPLPEGYVPPVVLIGACAEGLLKGPLGRGLLLRLQAKLARGPAALSIAPGGDVAISRDRLFPLTATLFAVRSKDLAAAAGNPARQALAFLGRGIAAQGAGLSLPGISLLSARRALTAAGLSPRLRNRPIVPGETRVQSPPALFMLDRHVGRFETLWPQAAPERRHILVVAEAGATLDPSAIADCVAPFQGEGADRHLLIARGAAPAAVRDLGFASISLLDGLSPAAAAAQRAVIVAAMDEIISIGSRSSGVIDR